MKLEKRDHLNLKKTDFSVRLPTIQDKSILGSHWNPSDSVDTWIEKLADTQHSIKLQQDEVARRHYFHPSKGPHPEERKKAAIRFVWCLQKTSFLHTE